jgi:hypothetical protein
LAQRHSSYRRVRPRARRAGQKWDPKLFINAEPGSIFTGAARDFCRTWSNQKEITVKGIHFIQKDSPHEIGNAVADFTRSVGNGAFVGDSARQTGPRVDKGRLSPGPPNSFPNGDCE